MLPNRGEAAVERPAVSVAEGDTVNGRHQYLLREKLGQGGFGAVFLADRIKTGAPSGNGIPEEVAIKCFLSPEGMDVGALFKRELSALLALNHPRIPRVFDWGIEGDVTFVVLQYVRGGSLNQWRATQGRLGVKQAWRLMRDLLEALTVAHRASILHLDIKPANVLIGDDGGYLLTDFGISQGNLMSSAVISPGVGTPGYRAPEQEFFREKELGCQTDLWGVGATVWAAFAGVELGDPDVLNVVRVCDKKHGLLPLRQVRDDCPPDLEEIVMRLVASKNSDRPGSAAEVLNWIRECADGVPVAMALDVIFSRSLPAASDVAAVISQLIDPLWVRVFRNASYKDKVIEFQDGDYLCRQNESSFYAFVLLAGKVIIEHNDRVVGEETREGVFLGEVSTLTGLRRTASMRAEGPVWVCVLNAAQLEQMVTADPAIGIRLIKSLAERVANDRIRK